MNRSLPLPPDASTLRRLLGMAGKIRRNGPVWMLKRIAAELRHPARIPGKVWRTLRVLTYAGSLGLTGWLISRITGRSCVYLFYDFQVSPITYDICWPLAAAERLRLIRGLKEIHVVFVPGPDQGLRTEDDDYETVVDKTARRRRIMRILLPALQLLPSVSGYTICRRRGYATWLRVLHSRHIYPARYWPGLPVAHKPIDVLEPARHGEDVPLPLRATPQALHCVDDWCARYTKGRKLVVVTLRDYAYMPQRNSNLQAWGAFAAQLDKSAFQIIFIADTRKALSPPPQALADQLFFPEAAANISLRMAVYERAYLNLMVNNGPHGLCMFNENCRYLMFKILTESARQTTTEYMEFLGFEIGQSPPFSRPWQKWVWENDTLPVIKREFDEMCRTIDAAAL